jgi:hypothetical protein
VLFLVALFALPMGTCGGIGTWKATDAGRKFVETPVSRLATTRDGEYLSFDAELRHVATDELPLGDGSAALARGTALFAVDGAPGVFVAATKGSIRSGAPHRIEGRICSESAQLACSVDDGVRIFLRAEERKTKRAVKVVTFGASPRENVWEAAIGLTVSALLGVVLLAVTALIVRGRRKPFIFVERVVPIRQDLDPARLRVALGPSFREAQTTAEPLVFLLGVTASRAQALGAVGPDAYPQRVEIWREPGAVGYRQGHARVRVSEIFAQPAGPLPQILPTLQVALETTLQRVASVLCE